jgi:hypothetical protein
VIDYFLQQHAKQQKQHAIKTPITKAKPMNMYAKVIVQNANK